MINILEGYDQEVAAWAWQTYQRRPINIDKAIGILNDDNQLVGAVLLSNFNGFNIEFGYYGKGTLTRSLIQWIANLALKVGVSRATILVNKKNRLLLKFLTIIGAKLEGVSRRYYGQEDTPRNTAVRFVLFREDFIRLAQRPTAKNQQQVA